ATTPVDPRVFEAMRPYFVEVFGNAASRSHGFGQIAAKAVDCSRELVAALLGAEPKEIIWTSGSTEANNLAIKGVAEMYRDKGRHIITQVTEHKAVLDPCKKLQRDGYEITWLPVDRHGRVSAQQVAEAIRPDTILVSIMWANNEIGTVMPIRQIGEICHDSGVLFHTDATQAVGKERVDVQADNIDLLSFSGHKMYGPKGCGALYVRSRGPKVRLAPLLDGGGHERGFRSGTLNVPGIVGVGAACEVALYEGGPEATRLNALRNRLQRAIFSKIDGVTVNGDEKHRLAHVTNLSFADIDGPQLLAALEEIAVSSGSACTSASMEPSYVLKALGVPNDLAYASIRFSLGKQNTEQEADYVADRLAQTVRQLRETLPVREIMTAHQQCV
ncbi:MAG TPA: aminotransferase class V-fold PLP-dependent enzyme, partial [Tepidisphaeraceae bacterium]